VILQCNSSAIHASNITINVYFPATILAQTARPPCRPQYDKQKTALCAATVVKLILLAVQIVLKNFCTFLPPRRPLPTGKACTMRRLGTLKRNCLYKTVKRSFV
jgi:hypothetical protein